jgi:hypothetical protein
VNYIPVFMPSPHKSNPIVIALYVNAALLLAIVVLLLSRSSGLNLVPEAFGQRQLPIAGGAGIFVMPAQFSVNTWGCYLLDVDRQTLCAYEFYPGEHQLRLIAARGFLYDRQLQNDNTSPSPQEIQRLVEEEQQSNRVMDSHAPAPSPEAPPA